MAPKRGHEAVAAEQEGPAVALLAEKTLYERGAVVTAVRHDLVPGGCRGVIAGLGEGARLVAMSGGVGYQLPGVGIRTEEEAGSPEKPFIEDVAED